MAIQTGLEGKPAWQGAVAGLLVAAVLVGGGYWLKFKGQYEQLERMDRELQGLQQQITEGRAAKAKLPQFREEVRRLELELEKLLRILPARRNTPELLRRIRQLTEQGNFDLLKFTPGNFVDREFYSEWPINVRLNGTYHNLALFFDRIGRFSRIINIENLQILGQPSAAKGHSITASFVAKTFVYKEPEPTTSSAPGQR
ncbi:MAG: type 4a pilus biogenesis protein PilO [Thermoanaerobaculia bacterium]|jgi:type IV pilus assembly protein PilO|nr:MAG: type 4a pilus biogenesis protein PilO [Thermoanaerobaculia bacterium]MBZ0102862.1 type 4a pilus biogenesis protein PilO [Thermoanaerobaculia bacterium]